MEILAECLFYGAVLSYLGVFTYAKAKDVQREYQEMMRQIDEEHQEEQWTQEE